MEENDSLDIYGMSRYLCVSTDSIRRLIRKKQLPIYRVGIRIFTRKTFLDQWILAQITNSVEDNIYENNADCEQKEGL